MLKLFLIPILLAFIFAAVYFGFSKATLSERATIRKVAFWSIFFSTVSILFLFGVVELF